LAQIGGQALEPQRFDLFWCMRTHIYML
jgi:hypothetical protein